MDRIKKVFCKLMVAVLCITLMPVPETEAKAASIKVTKSLNIESSSSSGKGQISVKGPRIKKKTFKSSNKKIATVTKKGKVIAKAKQGTCKITVTVKYKKKKKDKKLTKKKFICRVCVYHRLPPCGGTGIPLDYYRNKDDVKALNNIIQQQRERGANVSGSFSEDQYHWLFVTNSNGDKELRLKWINWNSANLKGEISFQGLDELCALYCYDNQLTKVDLGENTKLEYLDVSSNDLTTLNVSKNTILKYLDCEYNHLSELDVNSNTMLERLSCRRNQLSSLDVSKNVALERLYCSNNKLTNLDVSQNTELTELTCDKDVVVTGYKEGRSAQKNMRRNKD